MPPHRERKVLIGERVKHVMRRRGEFVERSFAHTLDRGGMRRAWLRGRENITSAIWALALIVTDIGEEPAFLIIAVVPKARWKSLTSATGC